MKTNNISRSTIKFQGTQLVLASFRRLTPKRKNGRGIDSERCGNNCRPGTKNLGPLQSSNPPFHHHHHPMDPLPNSGGDSLSSRPARSKHAKITQTHTQNTFEIIWHNIVYQRSHGSIGWFRIFQGQVRFQTGYFFCCPSNL